jgi:DNA-binding NarL/FixJ family response regulator
MFQITGLAANGFEALEMYRQCQPDLVLMDVSMPMLSGTDAAQMILQEWPDAHVVMMAVMNDDHNLLEAIRLGACGYVLKDATRQQLQHLLLGYAAGDRRRQGPKQTD